MPRSISSLRLALLLLTFGLSAFLAGCDSGDPVDSNRADGALSPFDRERSVRHAWSYTVTPLNDPDAATTDSATFRTRVVDVDASVAAYDGLVRTETTAESNPDDVTSTWYLQRPDSLTEVAYRNAGATPTVDLLRSHVKRDAVDPSVLSLPVSVRRAHARQTARSGRVRTSDDSTFVRDDPRVVLKRPLLPGRTWTSFRTPFRSDRTIRGAETRETPAGSFECVAVDVDSDVGTDALAFRDCLGDVGLVHRVIVDTVDYRTPNGTSDGKAETREVVTLLEIID